MSSVGGMLKQMMGATVSKEVPDFAALLKIDKVVEAHSSSNFEKEDQKDSAGINEEAQSKKFNNSVKSPAIEKDVRTLYLNNLAKLQQLYGRDAFLSMLSLGYSDETPISQDLGTSSGVYAKLCTLIHKELTIANFQWIESKNKAAMKDCQ